MSEVSLVEEQLKILAKLQEQFSNYFVIRDNSEADLAEQQEKIKASHQQADQEVNVIFGEARDIEWAARRVFELANYDEKIKSINSDNMLHQFQFQADHSSVLLEKARRLLPEANAKLDKLKKEMGEGSALKITYREEDDGRYIYVDGNVKQRTSGGWGWMFVAGIFWIFIGLPAIARMLATIAGDISLEGPVISVVVSLSLLCTPPVLFGLFMVNNENTTRLKLFEDTIEAVAHIKAYILEHHKRSSNHLREALSGLQTEYNQRVQNSEAELSQEINKSLPEITRVTQEIEKKMPSWNDESWLKKYPDPPSKKGADS